MSRYDENQDETYRPSWIKPAVLIGTTLSILCIAAIIVLPNMGNLRVPAGYAGYIYTKPIFGKSVYKETLIGPASTGWKWRLGGNLLSITPYTYPEEFNGKASALAKDKLSLDARCHIVWKLKHDETNIKRFMEEFGGLHDNADPDAVALEAYNQFIKEPFRTETRAILARYNGLDVNAELPTISNYIQTEVAKRLTDTPFEIINIVMGNANPPQVVIDAISNKVASEQTLQQRSIQLEISKKNIDIETADGQATGARSAAQAVEEAKAIASLKAALSPEYIQYLGMLNIKGAERIYVPTGSNILVGAGK